MSKENLYVEYGLWKLANMGKEMEDGGCLMDKKIELARIICQIVANSGVLKHKVD